jgi:hypothetical protein
MCGMEHDNPVAFLWHINACELERASKQINLFQGGEIMQMAAVPLKR